MVLGIILANMGISVIDFTLLSLKDYKTTNEIIKKYTDYDYEVINKFNLRSKLWKEIFKNSKIKDVEEDDITLFYAMTLVPITNVIYLYNYLIKNKELDLPFKLCVDKCLDDKIIKNLIKDEIIKDDDFFELNKSLVYEMRD